MKSIQHLQDKIKGFGPYENSLILQVFIVVFVAIGSFFLGRLSLGNLNNDKVSITNVKNESVDSNLNYYKKASVAKDTSIHTNGMYVASKNGKLYYRVGCGASSRIKEENKVFFDSMDDAISAGFEGSDSCTP